MIATGLNTKFVGRFLAGEALDYDYKVALLAAGATVGPNLESASELGSEEYEGEGYKAGGLPVGSLVIKSSGASHHALTFEIEPKWVGLLEPVAGCVFYATQCVVGVVSFGKSLATGGGVFKLTMPPKEKGLFVIELEG